MLDYRRFVFINGHDYKAFPWRSPRRSPNPFIWAAYVIGQDQQSGGMLLCCLDNNYSYPLRLIITARYCMHKIPERFYRIGKGHDAVQWINYVYQRISVADLQEHYSFCDYIPTITVPKRMFSDCEYEFDSILYQTSDSDSLTGSFRMESFFTFIEPFVKDELGFLLSWESYVDKRFPTYSSDDVFKIKDMDKKPFIRQLNYFDYFSDL